MDSTSAGAAPATSGRAGSSRIQAKQTNSLVEAMKQKQSQDLSVLRPNIQVSVTGLKQAILAAHNGTNEIRNCLMHECNVIYECKVCLNLFRTVTNFVSHKRSYCQLKHAQTRHKDVRECADYAAEESTSADQTADSADSRPEQSAGGLATVFVVPEDPVETVVKEPEFDLEAFSPTLALMQEAGIISQVENRPLFNRLKKCQSSVESVAKRLKEKVDRGFDSDYYACKELRLERMRQTPKAVFQTYGADGPSMGERYVSWQSEKQKTACFVGPNGKPLLPGASPTSFVDKENRGGTNRKLVLKLTCPLCKKVFPEKSKTGKHNPLKRHLVRNHDKKGPECKTLLKSAKRKTHIVDYDKLGKVIRSRPYKSDGDGVGTEISCLNYQPDGPVKCTFCGRGFNSERALSVHRSKVPSMCNTYVRAQLEANANIKYPPATDALEKVKRLAIDLKRLSEAEIERWTTKRRGDGPSTFMSRRTLRKLKANPKKAQSVAAIMARHDAASASSEEEEDDREIVVDDSVAGSTTGSVAGSYNGLNTRRTTSANGSTTGSATGSSTDDSVTERTLDCTNGSTVGSATGSFTGSVTGSATGSVTGNDTGIITPNDGASSDVDVVVEVVLDEPPEISNRVMRSSDNHPSVQRQNKDRKAKLEKDGDDTASCRSEQSLKTEHGCLDMKVALSPLHLPKGMTVNMPHASKDSTDTSVNSSFEEPKQSFSNSQSHEKTDKEQQQENSGDENKSEESESDSKPKSDALNLSDVSVKSEYVKVQGRSSRANLRARNGEPRSDSANNEAVQGRSSRGRTVRSEERAVKRATRRRVPADPDSTLISAEDSDNKSDSRRSSVSLNQSDEPVKSEYVKSQGRSSRAQRRNSPEFVKSEGRSSRSQRRNSPEQEPLAKTTKPPARQRMRGGDSVILAKVGEASRSAAPSRSSVDGLPFKPPESNDSASSSVRSSRNPFDSDTESEAEQMQVKLGRGGSTRSRGRNSPEQETKTLTRANEDSDSTASSAYISSKVLGRGASSRSRGRTSPDQETKTNEDSDSTPSSSANTSVDKAIESEAEQIRVKLGRGGSSRSRGRNSPDQETKSVTHSNEDSDSTPTPSANTSWCEKVTESEAERVEINLGRGGFTRSRGRNSPVPVTKKPTRSSEDSDSSSTNTTSSNDALYPIDLNTKVANEEEVDHSQASVRTAGSRSSKRRSSQQEPVTSSSGPPPPKVFKASSKRSDDVTKHANDVTKRSSDVTRASTPPSGGRRNNSDESSICSSKFYGAKKTETNGSDKSKGRSSLSNELKALNKWTMSSKKK